MRNKKDTFFRSRCLSTETCAADLAILASSEYPSCDSTAEWREVRVERVAENEREREREKERGNVRESDAKRKEKQYLRQ